MEPFYVTVIFLAFVLAVIAIGPASEPVKQTAIEFLKELVDLVGQARRWFE